MILSKQFQKVLAYIENIQVPAGLAPQELGRVFYEQFIPLAGEKEAVHVIEEQVLTMESHSIPLRIYQPNEHQDQPTIIYFHGGWFNAGSLATHDTPLRQLANLSRATIIAVDYRLAPEHPFPAGLNDCAFAVQWIIDHAPSLGINSDHIILAGDSAGGALCATVARKFRQQIVAQLLIYPVTDNSLKTPSWTQFQNGPLLNLEGGIQAWDWYLPKEDQHNPDAVPLLADDLENLPPTFIGIAQYDPLRDEAIAYAEKLNSKGVKVSTKLYEGTTHGFFQMGGYVDDTQLLLQDMAAFIKSYNALA